MGLLTRSLLSRVVGLFSTSNVRSEVGDNQAHGVLAAVLVGLLAVLIKITFTTARSNTFYNLFT